jgi:hypothetical protein
MFPKKKLSKKTLKLLAKGYEESAKEDLEIAKDFEAVENEIDPDSNA